jgi:hypothetical protein
MALSLSPTVSDGKSSSRNNEKKIAILVMLTPGDVTVEIRRGTILLILVFKPEGYCMYVWKDRRGWGKREEKNKRRQQKTTQIKILLLLRNMRGPRQQ